MSVLQADFVMAKPSGEQVAIIEVKNASRLNSQSAAFLRRNMLAHGLSSRARFFVVLTQDDGFVWDEEHPALAGAFVQDRGELPPTRHFPFGEVARRYLPAGNGYGRLREAELTLLIQQWLLDLTGSTQEPQTPAEQALDEIGFLDAVRGTRVQAQALV